MRLEDAAADAADRDETTEADEAEADEAEADEAEADAAEREEMTESKKVVWTAEKMLCGISLPSRPLSLRAITQ